MTTTLTDRYVTPEQADVKVGDFFVSSWGYDQTNVDFYRVVALTPKGMKVQKWRGAVDHSDIHDYLVPNADGGPFTREYWQDYVDGKHVRLDEPIVEVAPIEQKRIQMWDGPNGRTVCANVNSYSNMYKWDGKPQYQTGAHYGH